MSDQNQIPVQDDSASQQPGEHQQRRDDLNRSTSDKNPQGHEKQIQIDKADRWEQRNQDR